jgi:hypothetical protein
MFVQLGQAPEAANKFTNDSASLDSPNFYPNRTRVWRPGSVMHLVNSTEFFVTGPERQLLLHGGEQSDRSEGADGNEDRRHILRIVLPCVPLLCWSSGEP